MELNSEDVFTANDEVIREFDGLLGDCAVGSDLLLCTASVGNTVSKIETEGLRNRNPGQELVIPRRQRRA